MSFREQQLRSRSATRRLLVLFAAMLLGVVFSVNALLSLLWFLFAGRLGVSMPPLFLETNTGLVLLFVLGGTAVETARLRSGGGAHVAQWAGGRRMLTASDPHERRLMNIVDEMAIASGQPRPMLFVLERESAINAFAAGWSPEEAALAVTRGALDRLTRDELQGLVAHEFGHMQQLDLRLNMILLAMVWGLSLIYGYGQLLSGPSSSYDEFASVQRRRSGLIDAVALVFMAVGGLGWLAGRMLQAAVSRQREFLADACALQFTRNRDGIGGTLRKIWYLERTHGAVLQEPRARMMSAMLLSAPSGWLASHPPLSVRIKRLYGREMQPMPSARVGVNEAEETAMSAASSARLSEIAAMTTAAASAPPADDWRPTEGERLADSAAERRPVGRGHTGGPTPDRTADRTPEQLPELIPKRSPDPKAGPFAPTVLVLPPSANGPAGAAPPQGSMPDRRAASRSASRQPQPASPPLRPYGLPPKAPGGAAAPPLPRMAEPETAGIEQENREAMHRMSLLHGPTERRCGLLSLMLLMASDASLAATSTPAARRDAERYVAWKREFDGFGGAERVLADVRALTPAVRMPWFERLLDRGRTAPAAEHASLLQAAERLMGTGGLPGSFELLCVEALRRTRLEPPPPLLRAASKQSELADLSHEDVQQVGVLTSLLSELFVLPPDALPPPREWAAEGWAETQPNVMQIDRNGAGGRSKWAERVMAVWQSSRHSGVMPAPDGAALERAVQALHALAWLIRPQLVRNWAEQARIECAAEQWPRGFVDAMRLTCRMLDCPMPPGVEGAYTELPRE